MGDAAPREGNIGGEVQTMVSRCLKDSCMGKNCFVLFCFSPECSGYRKIGFYLPQSFSGYSVQEVFQTGWHWQEMVCCQGDSRNF